MSVLKVALCDEDEMTLTVLSSALKTLLDKKNVESEMIASSSIEKLSQDMKTSKYDLVFLDVTVEGEDGIAFAKQIKKENNQTQIVFVSHQEERVFDCFQAQPFSFIRKRFFIADIQDTMERFFEEYQKEGVNKMIELTTPTKIEHVSADDIIYIESYKDWQNVHLVNQTQPLVLNSTMTALEEGLRKYHFIRIHKGFIVNARHISSINGCKLTLKTEQVLFIASKRAKRVREECLAYNKQKFSEMFKLKK